MQTSIFFKNLSKISTFRQSHLHLLKKQGSCIIHFHDVHARIDRNDTVGNTLEYCFQKTAVLLPGKFCRLFGLFKVVLLNGQSGDFEKSFLFHWFCEIIECTKADCFRGSINMWIAGYHNHGAMDPELPESFQQIYAGLIL